MKRKEILALLLIAALMAGVITAGATRARTPGTASDPLLSLNWVNGTFLPNTVNAAGEKIEESLESLSQSAGAMTPDGAEYRVKAGDVIRLESGSGLVCMAGSLNATSVGDVVDLTEGATVGENGELFPAHRYLVAENAAAEFIVGSDTAVVRLNGPYAITPSNAVDYNALAWGLKNLGLFRGTDTPFGEGYDLERTPTRIQGLIMFLRLLGEEKNALAFPGGAISFPDVAEWALPYVAYAYEKGYTKGQTLPDSQNRVWFGSDDPLAARDYMTFLLRALGYTEGRDFNWITAIPDAGTLGVLTSGEEALLTEKPFLRAQVVYLSWFALDAKLAGEGTTLSDRLINQGTTNQATLVSTRSSVKTQRL